MAITFQERGQILRRAIVAFGPQNQTQKAIEEMGELLAAIARYHQATPVSAERIDNLQEEIADAKIMMEQLALIYGPIEVQKKEFEKLERLEKILSVM